MNGFDKAAEQEVNALIDSSFSQNRAEEQQVFAEQHHTESWTWWQRCFRIARLLIGAFMLMMGSISVFVYVLDKATEGNSDAFVGVAAGVVAALSLSLHMTLRQDLGWLGEWLRGFQD